MDSGIYRFQFIAGHLALDFINTIGYRADPERREERLVRGDDVLRWATQAELPDLAAMKAGSRLGPAALRHIRTVREQLFAVFHAIALGETIPADTLLRIGNTLEECRAKRRLATDGAEIRWAWR